MVVDLTAKVTPKHDNRLAFLAVMIAIASMTHMISFQWWTDRLTGQILLGSTLFLFFVPRSVTALSFFLLTSITHWFSLLPTVPNHVFFEMLVHMTLLTGILVTFLEQRFSSTTAAKESSDYSFCTRVFDLCRPYIIIELIILYLFTVIHKLNYDFFNPEVSCAVSMHHDVAALIPGIPEGPWTWWPTIIGTIVVELTLPLLFISRRTRSAGILIGIAFHFFLALHPHGGIYSFTGLLLTLYYLLLPDQSVKWLLLIWGKLSLTRVTILKALIAGGFGLTVFLQTNAGRRGVSFEELNGIGFTFWLPVASAVAIFYISAVFLGSRVKDLSPEADAKVAIIQHGRFTRLLWVFPLLVFLNGSCPYLGLKTTTAFAMFSNLRTEGGQSNHFFLRNYALFQYQDDLVEVLNSNDYRFYELVVSGDLLPWFEFRRMVYSADNPNLQVTYLRNGKWNVLNGSDGSAQSDHAMEPHPWLVAKFLHFRSISGFEQPMKCCW